MHLFAAYTQSHTGFLNDFFLPSLRAVEPDLPLHLHEMEQKSATGDYLTAGYTDIINYRHRDFIAFANNLPYGELIVCSDVDIQFFRPFAENVRELMEGYDMAFQTRSLDAEGRGRGLCMGFFCVRWSGKVRGLLNALMTSCPRHKHDESAMNFLLRASAPPVRFRLLPWKDYWSVTTIPGRDPEKMPEGLILHHGNGIAGVEAKLELMRRVREKVRAA